MTKSISYAVRGAVAAAVVVCAGLAQAAAITPTFSDHFGDLSSATFGGSGIPNNAVAVSTFKDSNGKTITLGLTAHQRYENGALNNDGAGTFYADPGKNGGNPANPAAGTQGSLWNFAWVISGEQGARLNDYTFKLFYDFDPETNTDQAALGSFKPNALSGAIFGGKEDSQNLMFSSLSNSWFADTPDYVSFDPFASGQYSFALTATRGGAEAARAAINVMVGPQASQVPEPASMALLGMGLLGLASVRRFRRT